MKFKISILFVLIFLVASVYGFGFFIEKNDYFREVTEFSNSVNLQDISKECQEAAEKMDRDIENCGKEKTECEKNRCLQIALTAVKGACCKYSQDKTVCDKILEFQGEGTCVLDYFCSRDGCAPGTTKCQDGTCQKDCSNNGGVVACEGEPDGVCSENEGCGCEDCNGKQDGCWEDAVCSENTCGCHMDETLCEKSASVIRARCSTLQNSCSKCGGDGSIEEDRCNELKEGFDGRLEIYNDDCGLDGCFPEKLGSAASCCPSWN